jgi:energy-coupling factor transport system permease protein
MSAWTKPEAGPTLLFTPGSSWVHAANPLTKLAVMLWAVSAAVILPTAGTAFLILGGVALAFSIGVGRPVVERLALTLTPLAIALFVVHGMLIGRPELVLFGHIAVSPRGLADAAGILARIAAVLTASLLFVTTTHPADMLKSLDARGVSPGLSYLIASPLLLLAPLTSRAKDIRDAQRARGLDLTGSWKARITALPALFIPLITLALTDLDHRALVLTSRAFRARKQRTVIDPPLDSRRQMWLRRGVITIAVLQLGLVRLWH